MHELSKTLARVGILTHAEALLVVPSSYQDCTHLKGAVPQSLSSEPVFLELKLKSLLFFRKSGGAVQAADEGIHRVMADAVDSKGSEVKVISFTDLNAWKETPHKATVRLFGAPSKWREQTQFLNPTLIESSFKGGVLAQYSGKSGLVGAKAIAEGVKSSQHALNDAAAVLLNRIDATPEGFQQRYGISAAQLLQDLHWPLTMEAATRANALARVITQDALSNRIRSSREREHSPNSAIQIELDELRDIVKRAPHPLTQDQRRAVWDIVKDLQAAKTMRRMLSGDVGTGKTLVYMIPAIAAYKAGATVAVLAPTAAVVAQVILEFAAAYPEIPFESVVAGKKLPDAGIMIGTTALSNAAKNTGRFFDFVITDEQQKFSVAQRQAMLSPDSNLLEATATAIPRTVALIGMGGIDVSILRECPVEKTIYSRLVSGQKAAGMFEFVKSQIGKGGQVAIIYPLVESEDLDNNVEAALVRFAKHFGERVAVIHGRLKPEDKRSAIKRMRDGSLDILISTTVIEVGLTLPKLRTMIVVEPERFGASQLHQMRGRLARTGGEGYFFMYVENPKTLKKESLHRLRLLVQHNDGFSLAERDAEQRGAGSVFDECGVQSGATKALFYGVELSYAELGAAAQAAIA